MSADDERPSFSANKELTESDLRTMLPQTVPPNPVVPQWGVISAIEPQRVKIDGPVEDPDSDVYRTLDDSLQVGDRVLCVLSGPQLVVLGRVQSPDVRTGPNDWLLGAKAARAAGTPGPAVAASTYVRLSGMVAVYDDTGSIIDPVTGIITIPVTGRWRITAGVPWSSAGSVVRRFLQITKDPASGTNNPLERAEVSATARLALRVEVLDNFVAGDQLAVWLWTDTASAGPENASGGVTANLTVQRVK